MLGGTRTMRILIPRLMRRRPALTSQAAPRFTAARFETTPRCSMSTSPVHRSGSNSYQRFSRSAPNPQRNLKLIGAGAGVAAVLYVSNLEQVPLSGRRRFNVISKEREAEAGKRLYRSILDQYGKHILPQSHPYSKQVAAVLSRLIPASGLTDLKWETYVVDDKSQCNAFVIPGGKVFVFSGMLEIANNQDRLAAVLGHEIGHVVASHAAERMSQVFIILGVVYLAAISIGAPDVLANILADLVFFKPASRKQETEADFIGLMLMSQACYNPYEAVEMWRRMKLNEQITPPQFLSTHPSSENRITTMQGWMTEAMDQRQKSDCGTVMGYVEDFKSAFKEDIW